MTAITYNQFLQQYATNNGLSADWIKKVKNSFKKITKLSINTKIVLNDLYNVIESLWLNRDPLGLFGLTQSLEQFKSDLISKQKQNVTTQHVLCNDTNMKHVESIMSQVINGLSKFGDTFTTAELFGMLYHAYNITVTSKFLAAWLKLRGYKRLNNGFYKFK